MKYHPLCHGTPPFHLPTVRSELLRAWERLQTFIFRAGKVILPVVVLLSFLNTLSTDGTFGNENTDKSALSAIGRSIVPIFSPMGISHDNWPAAVGIFTGIFAKEAVVGTLDALYSQMDRTDEETTEAEDAAFSPMDGVEETLATIPANLVGVADMLLDPLGLSIGDVGSIENAAADQEVSPAIFGSMVRLFDGRIGAFAYLLMMLSHIKHYLICHKRRTLNDLALHFDIEPDAMRGMLEQWIRKGRVNRTDLCTCDGYTCAGCCKAIAMEIYEWKR